MKAFLHHLFLPKSSNNHRPKILHNQSLLLVIALLFWAGILLSDFKKTHPEVLGISTNISTEQLLLLTNQKRKELGVTDLAVNNELAKAAQAKAKDMFTRNYWAHNSPTGTTPWVFIEGAGYHYVYAGENLARGFTQSKDVVDAWMASPSHRENMLSANYRDVGYAVATGTLGGEETVLVVEIFGNKETTPLAKSPSPQADTLAGAASGGNALAVTTSSFLDSFSLTKNFTFTLVLLFLSVFVLDMIIVERKKIIRLVGHNLDHILMLSSILLFVVLLHQGNII